MISVTIPKKGFKQKTVPTYRIINSRWISQNSWPFLTSFQKSLLSVFLRILLQNNFQEQQSLKHLFFHGDSNCIFWTGTGIPKKSVVIGRNDGKGPSDHDAEPLIQNATQ